MMKTLNAILFVVLIILAAYIFYKLIGIGELNKLDDILLIILIVGSFVLSALRYRIKKKRAEKSPPQ